MMMMIRLFPTTTLLIFLLAAAAVVTCCCGFGLVHPVVVPPLRQRQQQQQPQRRQQPLLHVTSKDTDADVAAAAAAAAGEAAAAIRSITFSNLRSDHEPQLLCNFLMELGACSTSITDADLGTRQEIPLFDEFDTSSMTRTCVTTHVWNHCHVSAQFPASTDLDWIMELVQEGFPDVQLPKHEVDTVDSSKDWVLHVQKSWKPIVLPPFVLRFPWHTNEEIQEAIALQKESANKDDTDDNNGQKMVELTLQGGIAFGTGEHPTTQLCLNWLGRIVRQDDDNDIDDNSNHDGVMMLMDYGSGSGVLGMAACKQQAKLTAVGVDIDVDSVQIANANADINHVNMKNYLSDLIQTQDDESKSVRLKANNNKNNSNDDLSVQVLPKDLQGPIYDACVANILAGPLVSLAPTLAGFLRPGGHLGLSGIMASQSEMILEAYRPFFDDIQVEQQSDVWVLVTGTRNQD